MNGELLYVVAIVKGKKDSGHGAFAGHAPTMVALRGVKAIAAGLIVVRRNEFFVFIADVTQCNRSKHH
ncbi:hypothetical protein ACJBXR_11485, partial [Streptococcus suis]